jgi:hypothetical protein
MADYIKVAGRDGNVYEVRDLVWVGADGPEEYIDDKLPGFMAVLRKTVRSWMNLFPNADPCVRCIIADYIITTMCEYPHGRRAARYAWKLVNDAEVFEGYQPPNPQYESRRPDQS